MNARGRVVISCRVGCIRCGKVATTEGEVTRSGTINPDLDSINYYYSPKGLSCTNCHLKVMAEVDKERAEAFLKSDPPS